MIYPIFTLSGEGIPFYASSHCFQSLEAIPQGTFVRQLDGQLAFLSTIKDHKYKSIIRSTDQNTPAFGNISSGKELKIQCIQPLYQEMITERLFLSRPTNHDLLSGLDSQGDPVPLQLEDSQWVTRARTEALEPIFIRYFPILRMLVHSFTLEGESRHSNTIQWSLTLEER